jgi:hypothetical protein
MGKRTPIAEREGGSGVRFETCVRHERRARVCGEGEGEGGEGVSCCSIPGQQMSGPSRVKKGSTAGICRSREAEVSVAHREELE